MKTFLLILLCVIFAAGCSGTKQAPAGDGLIMESPGFIVRVQSSYGDLQQIEVSVKAWLFDGEDQRPFDKKTTPFDIPITAGDFFVQLQGPQGRPEILLQLLQVDDGKRAGYVQSNEVCVRGIRGGDTELIDCMAGMR